MCAILILKLEVINLSGSGSNVDSSCCHGLLHHGGEVQNAVPKDEAVVIWRLTDLDSCVRRGLVYPSKKVMYMSARIDASITIILEVLHLLVDLFMGSNVLEVLVLVLTPVLEGSKLLLKLPCLVLSENWSKKRGPEFLVGSADIAGLTELVDAGLCGGLLNNELEFGIAHV